MSDEHTAATRIAEPVVHPNDNRVDVNYHVFVRDLQSDMVKEMRESHMMRYFFKPEIELLAAQTGFQCIHSEEWLSGKAIGCDMWGACFVLQSLAIKPVKI